MTTEPAPRTRLKPIFIAAMAFLLAAVCAYLTARVAAATVEYRSVAAVQGVLIDDGQPWARVIGDGLQVVIEGEAPSEAMRFRAMSQAGTVVDASRVIDNMTVAETAGIAAPEFAIEILRNDRGVSLIGLIPAETDREALAARIATIAAGQPVTDLLEVADYPVPDDWRPALDYALRALGTLPRSKISVRAGRVDITAIADSIAQQRQMETELARARLPEVRLGLSISAPRPVVTPFTVRFVMDDSGARFEACAADTEESQQAIIAAAVAAGAVGPQICTLALGAPTTTWGTSVPLAIEALADLGGGVLTFSDANVSLVAVQGTDPALFDRVTGALANGLPDVYALDAVLPEAPSATDLGPPTFVITLDEDGRVELSGRITDDLMNETARDMARARFGMEAVNMATRVGDDGLPPDWPARVLAGIEALSGLADGRVEVQPTRVTVEGRTGSQSARDTISRLLIERLGQTAEFTVEVSYVEALDPIAGLPTPDECIAQINAVTARTKITFDPGSATIAAGALPAIEEIAEILRLCANIALRVEGHTDSQGSDDGNMRLSQARAEAVLDALRSRRVPVAGFEAQGFGETAPLADNDTDAGREANRRIEFALIGAEPAATTGPDEIWPDAPGPLVAGTGTGGPAQPAIRLQARPEGLAPPEGTGEESGG
jgi:OmpA-OmpF porin, OOP family